MSREILFHGKREDNGEWVEGFYAEAEKLDKSGIEYFIIEFSADGYSHKVIPETVGQYAEFDDANKTKIFDGTILDFTVFDYNDHDKQYRGVVKFSNGRWEIWKSVDSEYYGTDGAFDLAWVYWQDDEMKVVGNIHDNPELLYNEI